MPPFSISKIISEHRPDFGPYISLYKHFHSNPELSLKEKETSETIHSRVAKLGGYDIFPRIGGYGVAAVLKNGPGPTVLLRADFDALPVLEKTGLPYASKKRMIDVDGEEKPVMHACGHDVHITSLIIAGDLLKSARSSWSGTVILCFQPAEEKGKGAQAMVDSGLYDKVPIPDIVLGAHVIAQRSGTIFTKRGLMASASDSFHVTLFGRSGHGSQPQRTVDPVVMAASTIMRLQTVVSREVGPQDSAVVTCGMVRAGDAENVIPETAELKLNVRNFDLDVRTKVLGSIKRVIEGECHASNAPKPAEIKQLNSFPLTINDVEVTKRLEGTFAEHFGEGRHKYSSPIPSAGGSEDFSILATSVDRPYSFFVYGGIDPEVWDEAEKEGRLEDIPANHTNYFAPAIMPTLQTGVDGYAAAALTWLAK